MAGRFSTIHDVDHYLNQIPKFSSVGTKAAVFSLVHMEKFCELMGNPEKNFKSVHVAGTNGKGTVCQMLASVYQQAGYKTGIYTSPHLIKFNERIKIDSSKISDAAILDFFQYTEEYLDKVPLTYFEISTCIAFWFFSKINCDIAIIETGLGGRLDATNVITPLLSVITSISMDHADILGNSISEISREKAGIIKHGKPVVIGPLPEKARIEIESVSTKMETDVYKAEVYKPKWIEGYITITDPETRMDVAIKGERFKRVDCINAAITFTVVRLLEAYYPVGITEVVEGIERLPDRFPDHAHFQKLLPDRDWYFDGAHNGAAIRSLIEHLAAMDHKQEPIFFLSMMKDKAVPKVLKNFLPFKNVYYIDTGTERCADCYQVLSVIPQTRCFKSNSLEILRILDGFKSKLVIFTGSFYFYEQVKHWMASQLPSDYVNDSGFCP